MPVQLNGPAVGQQSSVSGDVVDLFADLGSATGLPTGTYVRVRLPITLVGSGGATNTTWTVEDGVWRPASGQALWRLPSPVDGVAGGTVSEQTFAAPLFPARVFGGCRAIVARSRIVASAPDANGRTGRWRVGASGGVFDAALHTSTAFSAANRVLLLPAHASVASSTALRPTYYATSSQAVDSVWSSSNAPSPNVAVPDMLTTSLYVSLSVQQGASPVSTISVEWAEIYVE